MPLKYRFSQRAKQVCRGVFGALVVAAVLGIGLSPASAQTLREKRLQQEQDAALDEEAKFTSDICKTRISASIDWASFKARDGRLRGAYARDCDKALSAIERICREDGGRRKVKRGISRVKCGAGNRRRVVLEDGKLLYAIDGRGGNDHEYIYKYLKKKL